MVKVAVTEMVPDLIWVPYFFGSRQILAPRNLVPKKFDFHEIWSPEEVTKFLGDPKISKDPNKIADHFKTSRGGDNNENDRLMRLPAAAHSQRTINCPLPKH